MKCPECSLENPDDTRFCGHCGAPLRPPGTGSGSLTRTLLKPAFTLAPGTIFAERYKLVQEMGRGGMGVVYRARDSKLKRDVALKFISPLILAGQNEKRRFVREARAAAALSHPNICTVYEIDEHEGTSFISMEFVAGQTLRKKIESRPLKLGDALAVSIQVAEGLQEAHQKGIIHRDIKSANILVTDKGQAKITDFGLARPEEGTKVTQEGETIGTVAYMAPEQAQGGPSDSRTDIWSFGIVLYEMIAGEVPFRGDSEPAVIHSVLHKDPVPLTSMRSGVPLEFERIVAKCLEKDPAYRYQSVSDLLADLRRLRRDLESGKVKTLQAPLSQRRIPSYVKMTAAAGGALVLLIVFYYLAIPKRAPVSPLSRLRLAPFTGGSGMCLSPSWSPDGAWIAYASYENGNLDILKKPAEGGEATLLTSGPDNESQPAWSPDGRTIAFTSDREGSGIYLLPAEGGTAWRLTSFGANPAWSPDSETLAFDWCGNIYLVPSVGGEPRMIVSGTSSVPYMVWTPDGKSLIYWNRTKGDVYALSIGREKPKPLQLIPSGEEVSGLTLSRDGRTLFLSLGPFGGTKNLFKVRFDLKELQAEGDMIPLSVSAAEYIQPAVSPDGSKIAFTVCQSERHLWSFPLDSTTGLIRGEPRRLTSGSRHNYYPCLSPDGRMLVWTSHLTGQGVLGVMSLEKEEEQKVTREWGKAIREVGASFSPDGVQIAYSSTLGGSYQIWRMPSLGSVGLRLTSTRHPVRDTLTAWSPQGDTIAFYSNRSGNWDIWSIRASGNSEPQRLTQWESDELYHCWSPDGRHIAFQTDREGNPDIWIMDPDGGNPRPYVTGPADEGWSAFSPDGSRFYFVSNRSGAFNIWVMPAGGGEEVQVTDYKALAFGLPNSVLYTKFAVGTSRLIIPLETLKGDIYILENVE
jgi:serine/threonine protein kinase